MNPEIFRAYDIRGVADRDLTDDVASRLGRAIGSRLLDSGAAAMALGRDCRLSSDRIRDALAEGLLSTGLDVLDLGVVPTPLLYFALHRLPVQGGVMITGSHNAADYNGLKISVGRDSIHGAQIQQLRRRAEAGDFRVGKGRLERVSLVETYLEFMATHFGRLDRPLKIVVDCGNGTASETAPRVYRDMGCQVIPLYCEMDGRFPNHHPDPTMEENLVDLRRKVLEESADLGLAFDGDADRIGLIDDMGGVVWGDALMVLFSRDVLAAHPGATIIGEVKCSMNLYRDVAKRGGRGIMWMAGHSLIKSKMKEEKALLAGEMSGHIFFADRFFGYDDAVYAGARLLEIVARAGEKVSRLLSDLPPTFSTPELRVDTPERDKFELVRRARESLGRLYETIDVDGVRVVFDDGWGLIRASNTQPALVLRFEASSPGRLAEIRDLVEGELDRLKELLARERRSDGIRT